MSKIHVHQVLGACKFWTVFEFVLKGSGRLLQNNNNNRSIHYILRDDAVNFFSFLFHVINLSTNTVKNQVYPQQIFSFQL